jgi:hypothetical protein
VGAALRGFAHPTVLAFALALAPAAAHADAPLKSYLGESEEGTPSLLYYSAECDEEGAGECAVVTLDCSDYNGLALGLFDYDDKALGNWLVSNGAHPKLKAGSSSLEFSPIEMRLNENNGSWDIDLVAVEDAAPWLKAWKKDAAVTVEADKTTIALPSTPKDTDNLAALVKACATKPAQ